MSEQESRRELKDRRMTEPGAAEAYELGRTVRGMREGRGWSQNDLLVRRA